MLVRQRSEPTTFAPPPQIRGRHGGVEKKRGEENLTNDTPPRKGFWPPPPSHGTSSTPQVSVLCFSCAKIHDRAEQKLFWRGPKIFGRARSLVRFPPPIRFAPPPPYVSHDAYCHHCNPGGLMHIYHGRLIFIHLKCWEVLPFLTIQRQRCIKFRVLRAQNFYTHCH